MAVFGIHFQHISKMNRIAYRLTSFSATACASSYRSFGSSAMVSETAPQATVQHNGNISRFLKSANAKENMMNFVNLIDDDFKRLRQKGIDLLREHIVSDEMYKITSYYQRETSLFRWTSWFIFLAKTINYHTYNTGTMTHKQDRVINLIIIALMRSILQDDLADAEKIRFNVPAAHTVWDPYPVVVACDMMLAVTVNEAAKLSHDVLVNICLGHERQYRGQYMQDRSHLPNDDRLRYNSTVSDYKTAAPNSYWFRAIAQICGASELVIDIVTKIGFNIGMFVQFGDDINDLKKDLEEGMPSAAVIIASKKHPIIEDMILRKFKNEGDVEKAVELVNNSNGKEEVNLLATRYYNNAMEYLVSLDDSPYRAGLETIFRIHFEKKINGSGGKE